MTDALMTMTQMPMGLDGGHVMGWHWGWWAFWIVLILLLAWGMARGIGRRGASGGGTEAGVSAEETLRRRFAAGEIDEEEFNRKLEALRKGR